jgi:hypothetical protein
MCCVASWVDWAGGEGAALPAGRLLSLMGLTIQIAPVAAQIRGLRSVCGLCVFLLLGDLLCIDTRVWHILRHNYGTVGTMLTWHST